MPKNQNPNQAFVIVATTLLTMLGTPSAFSNVEAPKDLTLWYEQPAGTWIGP